MMFSLIFSPAIFELFFAAITLIFDSAIDSITFYAIDDAIIFISIMPPLLFIFHWFLFRLTTFSFFIFAIIYYFFFISIISLMASRHFDTSSVLFSYFAISYFQRHLYASIPYAILTFWLLPFSLLMILIILACFQADISYWWYIFHCFRFIISLISSLLFRARLILLFRFLHFRFHYFISLRHIISRFRHFQLSFSWAFIAISATLSTDIFRYFHYWLIISFH
jgi:hypothetical protein